MEKQGQRTEEQEESFDPLPNKLIWEFEDLRTPRFCLAGIVTD